MPLECWPWRANRWIQDYKFKMQTNFKMRNHLIYALKAVFSKRIFYGDVDLSLVLRSLVTTKRSMRKQLVTGSFVRSRRFEDGDPELALALDIGSSKIVALIGALNARKEIEILGFGEQILEDAGKDATCKKTEIEAGVRLAVGKAIALSGFSHVASVYSNYSAEIYVNRIIEVLVKDQSMGEIAVSDVDSIKAQMRLFKGRSGEKTLLIQQEYYTVDDYPMIVDPVGMLGERIEASCLAVGGDVSSLTSLEKCISRAELQLKAMYPSAIASAEAVLLEEEKEGSIAVVDFGAAFTHIAVFEEGLLVQAETLQEGGNNITLGIQEAFALPFEKCEALKRGYGCFYPDITGEIATIQVDEADGSENVVVSVGELAHVIKACAEKLVSVANSRVLAALKGSKPALGLVITGGGLAFFPQVERLIKELTGVKCSVGCPDLHLAPDLLLSATLIAKLRSPEYATSVGLLKVALNSRYFI